MARGASKEQARRMAYRLARRVGGPAAYVTLETPKGSWCPSYRISLRLHPDRRVRVIRASNGETVAITEEVNHHPEEWVKVDE